MFANIWLSVDLTAENICRVLLLLSDLVKLAEAETELAKLAASHGFGMPLSDRVTDHGIMYSLLFHSPSRLVSSVWTLCSEVNFTARHHSFDFHLVAGSYQLDNDLDNDLSLCPLTKTSR